MNQELTTCYEENTTNTGLDPTYLVGKSAYIFIDIAKRKIRWKNNNAILIDFKIGPFNNKIDAYVIY